MSNTNFTKFLALMFLGSALIGCTTNDTTGDASDTPDDISLAEIPDGSLFEDIALSPEVETKIRERAELTDRGLSLKTASLSDPVKLEKLGLQAVSAESAPYLEVLTKIMLEGLDDTSFQLSFDPDANIFPDIRNASGEKLISIAGINREIPTCTTYVPTALQPDENLVGYGGRAGTATEGICGGIAAAHSFLKLGVFSRDQLVEGDFFKEAPLREIQGRNRKKMTHKRLKRLHERVGATDCRMPATGFKTNNRAGLARFNRELSGYVNDPNRNWDCTLFVRTSFRGDDVLAHFEHVTGASNVGGTCSISTVNGLDQGNQKDKVPVAPGTNTWTSTPAGTPPFKLTGSTGANSAKTIKTTANVGLANYMCCAVPQGN